MSIQIAICRRDLNGYGVKNYGFLSCFYKPNYFSDTQYLHMLQKKHDEVIYKILFTNGTRKSNMKMGYRIKVNKTILTLDIKIKLRFLLLL
jgi:hypothetical protein